MNGLGAAPSDLGHGIGDAGAKGYRGGGLRGNRRSMHATKQGPTDVTFGPGDAMFKKRPRYRPVSSRKNHVLPVNAPCAGRDTRTRETITAL